MVMTPDGLMVLGMSLFSSPQHTASSSCMPGNDSCDVCRDENTKWKNDGPVTQHSRTDSRWRKWHAPRRVDTLAMQTRHLLWRTFSKYRLYAVELCQFRRPPHRCLNPVQGAESH